MALPAVIESGLNEAGTAVAVIVHPERGATATLWVGECAALSGQAIVRDVRLTFLTEFGEEISSYVGATLAAGVAAARPADAPVVVTIRRA